MTLPLSLYRAAARAALPFAYGRAQRRLLADGLAPERARERLGEATLPRPEGRLVWVHGASVGESVSALPLVAKLVRAGPVLVTSGTATSAAVLAPRLPEGAVHQMAPLDAPGPLARFLDHWRPSLAVMMESEVWPVTLAALDARAIPRALVAARLSARSLAWWRRMPETAQAMFGGFALVESQTEDVAAAIRAHGAPATVGGNLKAAAAPPPDAPEARTALAAQLGAGPIWAAVSTHPGEEEAVLTAHAALRQAYPTARLIVVPRHPARGDEVAAAVRAAGWGAPRRSRGEPPGDAPVYLADTMGETGLWLRLAPVVFVGGSLVPVGGHNPWEPAQTGAAILMGPLREAVARDAAELEQAGALETVADADALGLALRRLFADPEHLAARREAARAIASAQQDGAADLAQRLLALRA